MTRFFSVVVVALCACDQPTVTPPAAPFGLQLPGGTLGSVRLVQVRGSAEAGVTIELFTDATCAGTPAVTGTAEDFEMTGLSVTVPANQLTHLSTRAVRAELSSTCSAPIDFTHDDLAPPAPITTSVTATVTGAAPRVRLEGTTEAGARVRVFTNATCAGTPAGEATVSGTAFSLELAVPANTETSFTALAVDGAGNLSACSSPPLRFSHDSQPPAAPVLTALVPTGPSSNAQPSLSGTAEVGATVRFFSDANCTATLAGSALADAAGAFQLQLTVPRNTTTSVRAVAMDASGNRSACSNALTYRHDDLAPAIPVFAATTPPSPSRTAVSFQVPLTVEAGTTVQLFTAATCTGMPAFSQPASTGSAVFTVAVGANTRQPLSARALDAAGNLSPCATSAVEHDDLAPAIAAWTGSMPSSPTNVSSTFTFSGTGEAAATAQLYRSVDCTTPVSSGTVTGAGTFSFTQTLSFNTSRSYTVTLADAAGNVSGCSAPIVLTHDNVAPVSPVLWGTLPPSPSKSTGPVRFIGVAETNSTVRLYTSSTCAGLPTTTARVTDLISGSNSQGHFSASTAPVLGGTLQLFALAADAAGNTSPCTAASLSYLQRATSAWSDEQTIATVTTSASGTLTAPSVVPLPSGDAVAVWVRSQLLTSGVVTSTFSNGTWSTPFEFATTSSILGTPNVVSDASGTVLIGWTQNGITWVARRSAAGVWGAAENLGITSYGRHPSVALDGSGNGVMVSERFVTSTVRIIARRSVAAIWGAESVLSDVNYSSFVPRVALAPTGRAVVLYARNTGSGSSPVDELWSVTGELASGWGAPAQRSVAMVSRDDVALDLTASGDALAAWLQFPTSLAPMTPMVSQSTGTTWTAASALSTTTTSSRGLQARAFTNGEAVAAWLTSTNTLMLAKRSTAGVWGAASALPGGTRAFNIHLAAEPAGRMGLAWATGDGSGTAQYFWFSTFAPGGSWSTPQLLDVGSTTNDGVALTIDAQGRMVAVWTRTGSTESRVMARRLD